MSLSDQLPYLHQAQIARNRGKATKRQLSSTPQPPTGVFLSPEQLATLQAQGHQPASLLAPTEWQSKVLTRLEFEIGLFGGKMGGKSTAARFFITKGNPDLPEYDENGNELLVNRSYIYHPAYRATVIRKNQQDLDDFMRRCEREWGPLGGKFVGMTYEFPTGAVVAFGHLADKNSWMKYIGVEVQRFVFEEVALIGDYSIIEEVQSCCRSVYPELRPQIIYTSNYGGPGTPWIIGRFMDAKDPKTGLPAGPEVTLWDEATSPFDGSLLRRSRIWIPSTLVDNPHAKNDPQYMAILGTLQDPKLRAAYLLGDWTAFSGGYFHIFRPRKVVGEPDNALHVRRAEELPLKPWWHRVISLDWGYSHDAAVYWAAKPPDGRHIIYRELVTSQTTPIALGYEIGLRTLIDFKGYPNRAISLYVSPDAYQNRTGDGAVVDGLREGIARVLGPNLVHVPEQIVFALQRAKRNGEPLPTGYDLSNYDSAINDLRAQRLAGVTIRVANDARKLGWQYMLECMRWDRLGGATRDLYDPEMALQLLSESTKKFEEYVSQFSREAPDPAIPILQIIGPDDQNLGGCPHLITALQKAVHSEKDPDDIDKSHFKGMDSLDAARYLMMGMREEVVPIPFEGFRELEYQRLLTQSGAKDISDLPFDARLWLNRTIESKWNESHVPLSSPPPIAPTRRRRWESRQAERRPDILGT